MMSFLNVMTLLPAALVASVFVQTAQPAMAQQRLPALPIEFSPDNLINPGRPGGRRRGGGSRGSCQAEFPLTAIAAVDSRMVEELGVTRTDERVGALTTQADPILWFYLPGPVQETAAELVVKDSRDQVIFQGPLEGDMEGGGIIGLALSNLAIDSAYQWFLTIDCDEAERATVNGWVERRSVGPDALRTLTQATERNRVALYANYGFLQDALSELAKLRYFNPDDETVAQDWRQLLTALDLSNLSEAPILPCCLVSDGSTPALEPPVVDEETDVSDPDAADPVEMPVEDSEVPVEDSMETPVEEPDAAAERGSRSVLQRARDRGN